MEKVAEDYEGLKRQYLALRSIVNAKERTLAKTDERVKELEGAILDSCSTYHFEPNLSQPTSSLKELLRINSKWTLDPEISSDAAKFAMEKKIEALESCIDDNAMDNNEIDALIIYVDDVKADIEQLRKEQEGWKS